MKRPKLSKQAMHQKRQARLENAQNHAAVTGKNIFFPEEKKAKVRAFLKAREAIRTNAHPEVRNKRIGCKYTGWMTISLANKPAEERIKKLMLYGDWANNQKLDKEILPDWGADDKSLRRYEIDFHMTDITGNEFEPFTRNLYNPKNLDELDRMVKNLVTEIANAEGYLFNLDECYAEIRA